MSCQDFDRVVEELADGRLMDAAARDAGLGHAAVCVGCAARLMEARGIGAGLRVAARAETEEAPARVRAKLLAAFAEQHGGARAGRDGVPTAGVVALSSRRAARRWFAAGAFAAAAVILLSLTLPSLVRFSGGDGPEREVLSGAPPARTQAPAANVEGKPGILVGGEKEGKPGILVGGDVARANPRTDPARRARTRAQKVAGGSKARAAREPSAAARAVGNEYLPLTYLAGATAMESGTVVRVELSRSALISLGVPVGMERADELLKAEVVLGDDGVARAIRLVQD